MTHCMQVVRVVRARRSWPHRSLNAFVMDLHLLVEDGLFGLASSVMGRIQARFGSLWAIIARWALTASLLWLHI